MKKRFLAKVLTLCMVMTMVPLQVFATDSKGSNIPWSGSNGSYSVNQDVTISGTYTLSQDTYSINADTSGSAYSLTMDTIALTGDNTKLTVGGTIQTSESGQAKFTLANTTYLMLQDVTAKNLVYITGPDTEHRALTEARNEPTGGTVTISGGTFEAGLGLEDVKAIVQQTFTVKGGNLYVGEGASLTLNSGATVVGTIVGTKPTGMYTITLNARDSSFTLEGVSYLKGESATVNYTGTYTLPTLDGNYRWVNESGTPVTSVNPQDNNKTFYVDYSSGGGDHGGGGGGGGGGGSSSSSSRVTVASTTHGRVTVSPDNPKTGDTVTITVRPDDGYVLDTLTVTNASGKEVELTKVNDTRYTFVMPSSKVTVKATFVAEEPSGMPFTDVASGAWYYDAVSFVYKRGLMSGTGDNLFSPNVTTSRGMIVTILYRLDGSPSASSAGFTDVTSGQWYTDAVNWAAANDIVAGYGNGLFGPNDTVTREQMAVILYRYAQYKGYDTSASNSLNGYTDVGGVSSWALTAMQWANAEGLINGTSSTTLSPTSGATRAEVAQILMRFCENFVD
ncbi:S-layer homology domain-containing protein [Flavonifractor plautii]|uniref:S-layer homology domain-containing protein n=1 Tax=Flavonifractor plautii TaxID=292800 RepID=UPI001FAC04EF|nr:S-layer homology domain-containing protein [Flavonifractor plautii]MDB7912351.1 S-layer homology domain-containing protein [Flavonifractor plautii]MDB7916302.1 S-layer homology domain-containing protein [Flavonifractor plautii]